MKQNKFGAAGPHYGHMVQETLMLKYLLEANDDQLISLEYFDDVGIENSKGDRIAVQAKSGLSWNPVADSAIDLWKTIANWISMIADGNLDPNKTKFVIAIAKEKKGQLSSKMKSVSSEEDFKTIYKEIRTKFKKSPPKKTIAEHVNIFLDTDPEILQKILFNFDIELYSDPKERIIEQLRKQEEEKDIHDIYHMMSGWIKDKLEELIRAGKIPYIAATTFRKQLFACRRLLNQKSMLLSYASAPTSEETNEHLTMTYIRQLELIDCDMDEKIEAISSYIKARADKITWAAEGEVHDTSFDHFYDSIIRKWATTRRKTPILNKGSSPEELGKLVLYDCCEYREKLEGLGVPPYFTTGCFHDCSDKLKIGWHENYHKLLGDDDEQ